ncbi:MAG: hypothetical protein COT74_08875 [Bdellovibrionales bacterium CG10_big_fil_rev_8_21_14_0_10_45_34]|nr:MAG: hypothetical protein COT74_08875 [Bdellovibrionales bacterium CG10_big_fil_rev_8_21_14_0_10_45_34]
MIRCPKCNFLQPKDRYCANCGVDVDAFVPSPPTLGIKIRSNHILYATLALGVLMFLFWFVSVNRPATDRISDFAQKSFESEAPSAVEVVVETSPPRDISPTNTEQVETRSKEPLGEKIEGLTVDDVRSPSLTQRAAIRLTFAEIPWEALRQVAGFAQGSQSGFFRDARIQILSMVRETDSARQFRYLETRELGVLPEGPTTISIDFEKETFLSLDIISSYVDDEATRIEADLIVVPTSKVPQLLPITRYNRGTLVGGGGLYFVGLFPRFNIKDIAENKAIAEHPLLKVLTSQNYQEGVTELVLLIEAVPTP